MSDEDRVLAAIGERAGDLVDLAGRLIGFDTTVRGGPDEPPREEAAVQQLLAGRLEKAGAEVELWEPPDGFLDRFVGQVPEGLGFAGRPQLLARFPGAGDGSSLMLNGHIDTVSAEPREQWSGDPFLARVADGRLYGRGSLDMKGTVAAIVLAAEVLAEEGIRLPGELIVSTVTDEEWNGAGSLALTARGLRADGAIIPEATGFDALVACRGVVCGTITVAGRPGHAEMPQPGWREGGAVNAIGKAVLVLEALRELEAEWARELPVHPLLESSCLVPTMIEGGEWWVSYPASCRIVVDVAYLPAQCDPGGDGSRVEREIERRVLAAVAKDGWLAARPPVFEWDSNLPPGEIPADHPVAACALEAGRRAGRTGSVGGEQSWHDAASFIRSGTPAISFGPSLYAADGRNLAHAIDEYVRVDELLATAQALALAALGWRRHARRPA